MGQCSQSQEFEEGLLTYCPRTGECRGKIIQCRKGQDFLNNYIVNYQMENKNFKKMISMIEQNDRFSSDLLRVEQEYLVQIYRITELRVHTVIDLYHTMQKKFYLNRKSSNEDSWYENQLRIFIWLLFGYLFSFRKSITDLNEEDWKFFSQIFNHKQTVFFQFQSLSLIRSRPSQLWSQTQTQMLQLIINEKKLKNKWNSIARELFIRSNKKFYRNPKQCREQWMNHLDPSKIRTEWTVSEDLVLLNCIKSRGKRWSIAVKELKNTRTEHTVKNRFKSLISNEAKKNPGKKDGEIENILIKKLIKIQERQLTASPEQIKKENIQIQFFAHQNNLMFAFKQQNKELYNVQAQLKSELKNQSMKNEDKGDSLNLCQNLDNYDEFGLSSPMFIPWKMEQIYQTKNFDLSDDGKDMREEHFYSHIQSENEDFLPV